MKHLLAGLLASVLVPSVAGATTWYVGKSGSDSHTCAQAQNSITPKLTIGAGLNCIGTGPGAGAGDIVAVGAGVYAETIADWPSGTTGNPFTLKSTVPLGAIIRPGVVSSNILYFRTGYVTVDGFVIDGINVNANNVWLNSGTAEITIQNCEIKNTRVGDGTGPGSFQAIYAYQTSNAKIVNNRMYDLGGGRYNHALYWSSSNSIIENNTIYNVGGYAVQIWSAYGLSLSGNIVRNNTIYDFAKSNGVATGVLAAGTNTLVYNNVIFQTAKNPNAIGIALSGTNDAAYNNTVYNNGYIGIEVAGTGSVARNNITFQNGTNILFNGNGYTVDHNLTTDPQFLALSSFDFRLQPLSPAVDAGLSVAQVQTDAAGLPRPQGSAYDLGAFEYGDMLSRTPAPPVNLRIVN